MIVSALGSTSSSQVEGTGSSTLDKDAFLTLLVTQLQYQDPMSPMENTEFSAQMAQFSSLEELYNLNDSMESMLLYQASVNNSQAVGFIGKEVYAHGNMIQIDEEIPDSINYELDANSYDVQISIYDSSGDHVRTLSEGSQEAGEQVADWDGKDDDGNQLPDDAYTYVVSPVDENGSTVNVNTHVTGKVTGVTFDNGTVYLMIGEKKATLSQVVKINDVDL